MVDISRWMNRRPGWVRRTWARHPRISMAVRAALASSVSWYVAQNLPDPASDYPYYAPLGAVIATSLTLAGSMRESVQAVASIALGGAVGLAADAVGDESHPAVIALAVAVAIGVGSWRRLGSMASWVPTAALFTLVVGQGEAYYVGVYAGLVLLGALIGLGVNFLLPQLPLAPAQDAMARVRATLAEQLNALAEGLTREEVPDRDEWRGRLWTISPQLATMRTAVAEADEARRGNLRARRYTSAIERQDQQARALNRAADLVGDLTNLIMDRENTQNEQLALGRELRPVTAEALRRLAVVLGSMNAATADRADLEAAYEALDDLVECLDHARLDQPGGGTLVAGTVVVIVRRCLESVDPADEVEPEDEVDAAEEDEVEAAEEDEVEAAPEDEREPGARPASAESDSEDSAVEEARDEASEEELAAEEAAERERPAEESRDRDRERPAEEARDRGGAAPR